MPPNTVKVTRPGPFGNPFRVGGWFKVFPASDAFLHWTYQECALPNEPGFELVKDNARAVELFAQLMEHHPMKEDKLTKLRGKNLACWCKPDAPCHADVLLEIANDFKRIEKPKE